MVHGRKPDLKRRRRILALQARGWLKSAIGRALGVTHWRIAVTLRRIAESTPPRSIPMSRLRKGHCSTRLVEVLGVGLVALGFEPFTMPIPPEPPVTRNGHRPRKPR